MLENSIKAQNKFQLEINQSFSPPKNSRNKSYQIDTFIFLPKTLNINETTYSSCDFYKEVKNYIRLKSPITLIDHPQKHKAYIEKIKFNLTQLQMETNALTIEHFEHSLYLFCCSFEKLLASNIRKLIKQDKIEESVLPLLEQLQEILKDFRELQKEMTQEESKSRFSFVDEYTCFLTRRQLLKLLSRAKNKINTTLEEPILAFLEKEQIYCQEKKYLQPSHTKEINEEYIYRNKIILKKNIWSIFYLTLNTRLKNPWLAHFLFSMAAGISMVFATVIAFHFQSTYGNYSLPFFMALVIGYMGKDRIKEILKAIFINKITNLTADRKTQIRSRDGKVIGEVKERFLYINEKELPSNIRKTRYLQSGEEFRNIRPKENIINYKKKVELKGKRFWHIYDQSLTNGIKDILRLDISHFITKMDAPHIDELILENRILIPTRIERFYHMNIVVRHTVANQSNYQKFRVVFNRKGIRKLQKITS